MTMKALSDIQITEDGYFRYQCVQLTEDEMKNIGKFSIPFPLPFPSPSENQKEPE
jgi:hypothetical protein